MATVTQPAIAKTYLAVDNKFMFRDAVLVQGAFLEGTEWVPGRELAIPKDTLVKSGSLFRIVATKSRERAWFVAGTVANADAKLHFNLEDMFDSLQAGKLRMYAINTLEDVAQELDALVPGSEIESETRQSTVVPLRELLAEMCGNKLTQVNEWIAEAKRLCAEPVQGV